ncbi:hypothetical protein KHQ81_05015 [Mycoplasmatota bacterium]|nr:hypothetical protein KHQ81_05015 [Mycoplasmatota bacterium]
MIIWFVIFVALVYYLIFGNFEFNTNKIRNSYSTLDERLASGEISIEEYRNIKSALKEEK